MEEKSMLKDLTTGTVWKRLIVFALPFMAANLLQTVYTMVDAAVVGRFAGAEALVGVTNGGLLMDFYLFVGMGFASAGQVLIGQFAGKRDRESISRTIGTLFTFLALLGIAATVICIAAVELQLNLINIPEASRQAGRNYIVTCACGNVFVYGYNVVSSILRGMGDSKRPLVFVAIASVMNVVLDLAFVMGLGLGAFGAALATVVGQSFSFFVAIVYLVRHKEAFGFDFRPRSFLPKKLYLGLTLRLGVPMAVQFAAITISMLYVNSLVNGFGVAAAAVGGVGQKLESLLRCVSNSMGTAGSAMVAQCIGAEKRDRVPKVVNTVLIVCEAEALLVALVMFLSPQALFGLFTTDAEVLALCPTYRWAAIVAYFGFGLRAAYNAVVNGIGYASLGLVSGLTDGVAARIGFALLLGITLGFGVQGFWMGSALAGYVSAGICGVYYYTGRWRTRTLLTRREE